MDAGLYVRRRTGVKLGVSAASAAVMLSLYAFLIPGGGAMGAALATLLGFAFLAAATYAATQRVFPVRYEYGRLAALLGLAGATWAAGRLMPPGWVGVAGKAALLALAPALAWFAGLVTRQEKRHARAALAAAIARLRATPLPTST
jgi:O-antigen/teichoic acid export membrane protein